MPDAGEVVLADQVTAKVLHTWKPEHFTSNFPMFLDDGGHVAVVFRGQSKLALLDDVTGSVIASADTCGDADDLFFDAKKKVFYVSCGAGAADVVGQGVGGLQRLVRVETRTGARTSLLVPELERFFVAARAGILGSSSASILVFRTGAN